MARAQSQFLRVYGGSLTYARWQSYYAQRSVQWEGQTWDYMPFFADGITAGQTGDETNLTITMAATATAMDTVYKALARNRLVELRYYQFNTLDGDTDPQEGQTLVASYTGEAVGVTATLTTVTIELGSTLSPVGAQLPPRTFSTRLIGSGCRI